MQSKEKFLAQPSLIGRDPINDCGAKNPPVIAVDVTKPVSRILLSFAYCFTLESMIKF